MLKSACILRFTTNESCSQKNFNVLLKTVVSAGGTVHPSVTKLIGAGGAERPVARISETGHNIAGIVQLGVDTGSVHLQPCAKSRLVTGMTKA